MSDSSLGLIPDGHVPLRFNEASKRIRTRNSGVGPCPKTLARHAGRGWLRFVTIGRKRYTTDVWLREYLLTDNTIAQGSETPHRVEAGIDARFRAAMDRLDALNRGGDTE